MLTVGGGYAVTIRVVIRVVLAITPRSCVPSIEGQGSHSAITGYFHGEGLAGRSGKGTEDDEIGRQDERRTVQESLPPQEGIHHTK